MPQDNNAIDQAFNDIMKAKELLNKEDVKSQLEVANKTIESLRKGIEDRDKAIKEYQEINQKLFLRVSAPMQEQKQEEEPEDPVKKSALDKIAAHNKLMEEQANGSNNQQGAPSSL